MDLMRSVDVEYSGVMLMLYGFDASEKYVLKEERSNLKCIASII
jgi:hypothetical protein